MTRKKDNFPELLAPAGNMERLKVALRYGADAVYLGATSMSLRNFADNFTPDALKEACTMAHEQNKRIYVACNVFARDKDLRALPKVLEDIANAGADALIVSDPGVIQVARKVAPHIPLHLSTQANTLNSEAALFWHTQGVTRIILARELSLEEIRAMRAALPETLELEMFVHGAMCVSYSGRCLLSNYLAGRDSNKGECVQPCRWSYEFREKGKDGEYYPVEQDERGTYFLNSRDMNLLSHLDEIINSGVSSLKIEGRMKSIAYVATVVNAYRMALSSLSRGETLDPAVAEELERVSHRPYTTGFTFGNPEASGQYPKSAAYVADAEIAAVVLSYDPQTKRAHIQQRNRFFDGDTLNILAPGDIKRSFTVKGIVNEQDEQVDGAPHPKEQLFIGCDEQVSPGDLLRLIKPM